MLTIAGVTQDGAPREAAQARKSFESADDRSEEPRTASRDCRDSENAELVHDFRNILNTVSLLSELALIDLAEAPEVGKTVRAIKAACAEANDLCNWWLEDRWSRIAPVDCIDLSTLVRAMAPQLTAAVPFGATLRLDLSATAPLVDASPHSLRRVVLNLVKNAAESLENGSGEVTVGTGFVDPVAPEAVGARTPRRGATQRCCSVTVTDTGCGMNDVARARLLEGSFTTKTKGHGLGMASVRRIIYELGGTIEIRSEVGRGTRIRILLPCVQSGINAAAAPHARAGQLVDRGIRAPFDERRRAPGLAGQLDQENELRISPC